MRSAWEASPPAELWGISGWWAPQEMFPVLTGLDEVDLSRLLLYPTHKALKQINRFSFLVQESWGGIKILSVLLLHEYPSLGFCVSGWLWTTTCWWWWLREEALCYLGVSQHPWDLSKMKHFRSSPSPLAWWSQNSPDFRGCHPGVCCSGSHSHLLGPLEQFIWPLLAADGLSWSPKPSPCLASRVTEARTCSPGRWPVQDWNLAEVVGAFGVGLLLLGQWVLKDKQFMIPQQGHFLTSSLLFDIHQPNLFVRPQLKIHGMDKHAAAIQAEGNSSHLTPQLPWFLAELSFSAILCRYFTFSFFSPGITLQVETFPAQN